MRSALAFLTVIPVGARGGGTDRATVLAFPLVGLAIGCACALGAWGASAAWSPLVAAALVVALDLALTGGLHADAVADLADGIASRARPARALEIMREPQVGALGAVAVATTLLLRFAWLAVLAGAGLWALVAAVPVCGRAAMVVALSRSTSGSGPSLARGFAGAATPLVSAAVVGLSALACLAAGRLAAPGVGEGLALAALAGALASAVACERAWRRRFGALTGDAAGGAGVAAELAALAILALVPVVEG
jgi:adenosylcobinamide-GDP ribazoletransferase